METLIPEPNLRELLVLPAEWQGPLEQPSLFATGPIDRRRFPRFDYRCRAVLQYACGGPPTRSQVDRFLIYTVDISREGLSFLHHEALFPRETVSLWLGGDAVLRRLQIARCRRLGPRCFEAGGHFIASDAASESDHG